MKSVSFFKAKCESCSHEFTHASLGDFAYGEALFTTSDGFTQVYVSAFSSFAQRVKKLSDCQNINFWDSLAILSDDLNGKNLLAKSMCPVCKSEAIEVFEEYVVSKLDVPEASFVQSSKKTDFELLESLVKGGVSA